MKRVFFAIGAAALGFASMLLTAPTPSAAAPYTLNFSGIVTSSDGFWSVEVLPGDPISGSITYDPFNDTAFTSSGGGTINTFDQGTATAWQVVVPTFVIHNFSSGGGPGSIQSSAPGSNSSLEFDVSTTSGNFDLQLDYATNGNTLLNSLSGLPTNRSALWALLGGGAPSATGLFSNTGNTLHFNITATTPVPAALPLFISALGGLGLVAWRRRTARAAAGNAKAG
jgi:hypothetical protein